MATTSSQPSPCNPAGFPRLRVVRFRIPLEDFLNRCFARLGRCCKHPAPLATSSVPSEVNGFAIGARHQRIVELLFVVEGRLSVLRPVLLMQCGGI